MNRAVASFALLKVIDAGKEASIDGTGRAYVVTAPIEGEPLAKRIESQGRLTVPQVGEVAKQLANALAAVHDEELVHGDVQPGCIYLVGGTEAAARRAAADGIATLRRTYLAHEDVISHV